MENLNAKAFRQVGNVIEMLLKRYKGSKDEFGKELYVIYSHVFRCWQGLGYEKGYFKSKAGKVSAMKAACIEAGLSMDAFEAGLSSEGA